MKSYISVVASVASTLLVSGCVTSPANRAGVVGGQSGHTGSARYENVAFRGTARHRGEMTTKSNGFPLPPSYETGSPTSSTGYVKVYLSKTVPKPPTTTWYLDGASKGTVAATGTFKPTSRTGHTVSFTCLGNNKPPKPVTIDLDPYQKVTIPIYYE